MPDERARAAAEFIRKVEDRQFEGCAHERTVYTTLCQWCVTDLVADAVAQAVTECEDVEWWSIRALDSGWMAPHEVAQQAEEIARLRAATVRPA